MSDKLPKIINYCWFGGSKKSELIERCIESWKKLCPDYEIIEWNESNFDTNSNKYVREAYENKKWAFVSDYVRLWAVYQYGGFYLDTDVELVKSLDCLLHNDAFFSSENDIFINTGLGFGAKKKHPVVKQLLDSYSNISFYKKDGTLDELPCTRRNSKILEEKYGSLKEKMNSELIDGVLLLGKEYFCPFNPITGEMVKTENTIGIHWFDASWRSKRINQREKLLRPIKRILGVERFNRLTRKIK